MRQTNLVQQLHGLLLGICGLDALDVNRRFNNIFQCRAVAEKIERLKNHADILTLQRGIFFRNLIEHAVAFAVAHEITINVQTASGNLF